MLWARPGDRALQECNLSTGSPLDCGRIQACLDRVWGRPFGWRMTLQAKAQSEKLIVSFL
jgi:hypothetical protein